MADSLLDASGKVVIVTGASRGIGQSIAEGFAAAGAAVVLASRKQADLEAVAAGIRDRGGQALALAAHTGKKDTLAALVQQTVDTFGRVDVLVNNAATNPHFGPVLEADDGQWLKTLEVNLLGTVWLCQQVVPHMRAGGGGRIINIASIVGLNPGHFQGVYSASKAALISLTKTLALELGRENILVNAIAPGLIQTKFAQVIWENAATMQVVEARTPVGRIGQPEEIAGLALWLASPAAAFSNGAVYVVDGGMTLGSL
ncbi:MAG: glucose 1-dehydrogenase [Anaerolineae bacterium]|jgi:NAD(P)-dependent dehydrogenase (short-subunit alcohol dehydrogenase family)|nr:glucose 1-dehydrogenase [Anaerolineae bacterium]